jgi:hypothetical protein
VRRAPRPTLAVVLYRASRFRLWAEDPRRDREIALALARSEPGDRVTVHSSACAIWGAIDDEGERVACDCVVVTLVAGARA